MTLIENLSTEKSYPKCVLFEIIFVSWKNIKDMPISALICFEMNLGLAVRAPQAILSVGIETVPGRLEFYYKSAKIQDAPYFQITLAQKHAKMRIRD